MKKVFAQITPKTRMYWILILNCFVSTVVRTVFQCGPTFAVLNVTRIGRKRRQRYKLFKGKLGKKNATETFLVNGFVSHVAGKLITSGPNIFVTSVTTLV